VQDCERLLAKENEPIESNDERDKKLTTLLSVGSEFTKHFRFSFDPRLFIEPVGAAKHFRFSFDPRLFIEPVGAAKHFRFSFDPRLFIEPVGAAMPHAQPGLLSMFGLHVSFLVLTENSLC
jgi:hypothetical protein